MQAKKNDFHVKIPLHTGSECLNVGMVSVESLSLDFTSIHSQFHIVI